MKIISLLFCIATYFIVPKKGKKKKLYAHVSISQNLEHGQSANTGMNSQKKSKLSAFIHEKILHGKCAEETSIPHSSEGEKESVAATMEANRVNE